MMENKARDAEMMVTRLVEEAERRREEADVLKKEVENARLVLGLIFFLFLSIFSTISSLLSFSRSISSSFLLNS